MDHAAHRFAANGYHPTSVAEIVDGMGVGKGVFYWYFSSKEELFGEILRDAQHDLMTQAVDGRIRGHVAIRDDLFGRARIMQNAKGTRANVA